MTTLHEKVLALHNQRLLSDHRSQAASDAGLRLFGDHDTWEADPLDGVDGPWIADVRSPDGAHAEVILGANCEDGKLLLTLHWMDDEAGAWHMAMEQPPESYAFAVAAMLVAAKGARNLSRGTLQGLGFSGPHRL